MKLLIAAVIIAVSAYIGAVAATLVFVDSGTKALLPVQASPIPFSNGSLPAPNVVFHQTGVQQAPALKVHVLNVQPTGAL